MSIGVKFEWVNGGKDVVIRSLSGNYLYTVKNARDAYHQGSDIIVRGNGYETIKFSSNGTRSFL